MFAIFFFHFMAQMHTDTFQAQYDSGRLVPLLVRLSQKLAKPYIGTFGTG